MTHECNIYYSMAYTSDETSGDIICQNDIIIV